MLAVQVIDKSGRGKIHEVILVTRTMQVLFVLRFHHPDKTDKIDRLIHD